MAIQLSSSGMNTLDDGSSWGTTKRMYPNGTWVTYAGYGGTYLSVYRQTYGSGLSYGCGVPSVSTSSSSYTGIRVA